LAPSLLKFVEVIKGQSKRYAQRLENIKSRSEREPVPIAPRYPEIPDDYVTFITTVEVVMEGQDDSSDDLSESDDELFVDSDEEYMEE
jgi:hypothetical protein